MSHFAPLLNGVSFFAGAAVAKIVLSQNPQTGNNKVNRDELVQIPATLCMWHLSQKTHSRNAEKPEGKSFINILHFA